MGYGDDARGEVGVIGPSAVELRPIVLRVDVEVGDFLQLSVGHVVQLEDAQARAVVGLVHHAVAGVHVVVNGGGGADVRADERHVVEVLHVEDVGAGVDGALVQLVAEQDVLVVFGQPALVGVGGGGIACGADEPWVGGVGDVDDGQGVLVEAEGDLLAREIRIGPGVGDDLGVVGVAVCGEGADGKRVGRVADVHNVQAAGKGVRAHAVSAPDFGVDHDVVGVAEPAVEGVRFNGDGRIGNAAQLGQVNDLHAVAPRFGDDEGVIPVDLDIAPQGARRRRGQVGHEERIQRVGDVDEGGAVGPAHDHVFGAIRRVDPAPDVVGVSTAEHVQAEEGDQVDVLAGVPSRHPVLTGRLAVREGGSQQQKGQEEAESVHGAKVAVERGGLSVQGRGILPLSSAAQTISPRRE